MKRKRALIVSLMSLCAASLLALGGAGYADEARAWRDWLMRAVAGSPEQMQIVYGIAGERRLPEWEASWLPGFDNVISSLKPFCLRSKGRI